MGILTSSQKDKYGWQEDDYSIGKEFATYNHVYVRQAALREKPANNLMGILRLECISLKYFPERILARDFPLGKLKQVDSPHFDALS